MAHTKRESILVITLSNIGDVILTTPVIAALRAQFPLAKLTVVVGPKAAGLLEGNRQIDQLLIYDKQAGWPHKLKLLRSLREAFYDWVIDLRNSALPFLVRANHRSPVFRSFRSRNARERHLEILRRMKLPSPDSMNFYFFSKEDKTSLLEKLKKKGFDFSGPWLVVAPGAGSEAKRWRLDGFREVLAHLLEIPSPPIAVVGDEREAVLAQRLSEIDPRRVVNLAGETSLRELAALVSQAKLVLTNDSAVMHLGYELHRPVVALFGPTDPERYGRQNEIWRIVRETPPRGLEDLPSEKVFHACEALLNVE